MSRAHPVGIALLAVGSALSLATSPPKAPVASTETAMRSGAIELAAGETATVTFRVDVSCARVEEDANAFPQQVMFHDQVLAEAAGEGPDTAARTHLVGTVAVDGVVAYESEAWLLEDTEALALGVDLVEPCVGEQRCSPAVTWTFSTDGDVLIAWRAKLSATWPGDRGGACVVLLSEV